MKTYEDPAASADLLDKHGDSKKPSSKMFLHLPSDFARTALIYASYVGHYVSDYPHTVYRNRLDYYMFAVIDSGGMFMEYNGIELEINAGEVVLLDCSLPYTYCPAESVSFRYIYFRGGSSEAYYNLLAGTEGYFIQQVHSPEVQRSIQSIFSLVADTAYNEHRISAQMYHILAVLAEQERGKESTQNTAVLRAIAYMERHFSEKISIEQIASQVNLSEYYFSRIFRQATEMSPHAYLVNLRITMARQLLCMSRKSIERIAEECGFRSTTNFIRSFREHVGCTPKQFRRTILDQQDTM